MKPILLLLCLALTGCAELEWALDPSKKLPKEGGWKHQGKVEDLL